MKKFVTLTLSLALMILCVISAYADDCFEINPATNISVPLGGFSDVAEITEIKDDHITLDEAVSQESFEEFFYDALSEQKSSVNIYSYKIPSSQISDKYIEFAFSHPELFLVDNGFSYSVSGQYVYEIFPYYYVDKSEREHFASVMENKLNEYAQLVKDENDELKKYLLIHSKMIRESHYDYSYQSNPSAHTVYSFFVNGATTCQGYSNALKLIGDKVGLEVSYCFNRNSSVGHIWNYIKINGKWYHTDVTWDDYSQPLSDEIYNNENAQGAVHLYFLGSESYFSQNRHGNIYEFKTFEGTKKECNDTTYESNKWAFNLNDGGVPYLTDFDCDSDNLYFDLVGATDENSNPLKFVTNNLYGNDAYISLPEISESKAKYYWFSKVNLPASKIRLVYKNDTHINAVTSYDISTKNSFTLSSVQIPLDEEAFAKSNSLTMYNWAGLKPLAERNTLVTSE